MDDLEEIPDKFLETYKLSKLNNEETENLNRNIKKKWKDWISYQNTPNREKPRRDYFTCEFSQIFSEELTPDPLKLFQKN